jgi:hypothetical protein
MATCKWPDKIKHPSPAAARAALKSLDRKGRGSPDMNVYSCSDANGTHWHTGHSAIMFSKRIRKSLRSGKPSKGSRKRHKR